MEIRPILSALLRNKTGAILVAVQVAISMAILANALHIVQVRQAVAARPSGIAAEDDVFYIQVRTLGNQGLEEQSATQKREADAVRSVPGVLSVASVSQIPMSRSGSNNSVAVDRKQVNDTAVASFYVSPDSLVKTWGLKLVAGRDFRPDEVREIDINTSQDFPALVMVTKALAEKAYPGQSALGKPLYFGTGEDARETRIIGVVERLQSTQAQLGDKGEYSTIVPVRMLGIPGHAFTVRAAHGQIDRVVKDAEQAIRATSTMPVIIRTKTLAETRKERYQADVAMSWMLITVSVLLLLITASGVVGMASLWVQQRRKQIGVRRALGARRIDILRYFITENLMITSCGVVAGVLGAVGLNQFLVARLELDKLPILYLAGGACVFWILGVLAVYGPAWRAATISPATATRTA